MEKCDRPGIERGTSMVASDSFAQPNLPEDSIENIRSRLAMLSDTKIDMSEALEEDAAEGASATESSVVVNMSDHSLDPRGRAAKHDTLSMASTSSASSSSSSLSSMGITFESERRLSPSSIDPKTVKLFGPANDSQASAGAGGARGPTHPRIRRVPSTANPKYRVPKLQKNQRSHSQPHIFAGTHLSQRRNSSPSTLTGGQPPPPVHAKNMKQTSSMPNFSSYSQPREQRPETQPQQQIIYLQIPQPSQSQLCDPQALQQQISSQLQLLVPQIYNQLLNQITVDSAAIGHHKGSTESDGAAKDKLDSGGLPSPSFTAEGNQSQKVLNQVLQQNGAAPPPHPKRKRQKTSHPHRQSGGVHKAPSLESLSDSSAEGTSPSNSGGGGRSLHITDLSQILQHVKPHHLHQSHSKAEPTYIEIQQEPGYPKITIPLTQELLLQCQQLQQLREPVFQPRLETILEESLSVKHLKISRFSKTKIVACVVTILCVIGVILLAGDKTVAVAVVAAIFILFLLASTFYLYTHSSKDDVESRADSPRLQVSAISGCDKPSLV